MMYFCLFEKNYMFINLVFKSENKCCMESREENEMKYVTQIKKINSFTFKK